MAKVSFRYSSMNSGKSTQLLQIAHNYEELGGKIVIIKPAIDIRDEGVVQSRIGLNRKVDILADKEEDLFERVKEINDEGNLSCILVDEAQFLTKTQVWCLSDIADFLDVPVIAFGLRTDFQGQLFEGSQWLLAWADEIIEAQTVSVCHCGKKARFVLRIDDEGNVIEDGEQVVCGGNEMYISVCRKHFKEAHIEKLENKERK